MRNQFWLVAAALATAVKLIVCLMCVSCCLYEGEFLAVDCAERDLVSPHNYHNYHLLVAAPDCFLGGLFVF